MGLVTHDSNHRVKRRLVVSISHTNEKREYKYRYDYNGEARALRLLAMATRIGYTGNDAMLLF